MGFTIIVVLQHAVSKSDVTIKTVNVLLEHSNISTTLNLYVHPNMKQKRILSFKYRPQYYCKATEKLYHKQNFEPSVG